MTFSKELCGGEILDSPALGAGDYGNATSIDKRLLNVHFLSSEKLSTCNSPSKPQGPQKASKAEAALNLGYKGLEAFYETDKKMI